MNVVAISRGVGVLALSLIALVGCESQYPRVRVAWASSGNSYANTDSLAAVMMKDASVRVYATSKDGHRLEVIDGSDGKLVGTWGKPGGALGELQYPNGIATIVFNTPAAAEAHDARPAIAVVERDNRRIQCFWPDTGASAGTFGEGALNRPYGVALSHADGKTRLYVTDTQVAGDRVAHIFELERDGDTIRGRHVRSFGEPQGPGWVQEAESVLVDDAQDRVLLCDELVRNVKVYTRDGRFTGRTFGDGLVVGDPEGLVFIDYDGGRFVVLTDQRETLSVWHVFDATSYELAGSWIGDPATANTDGIAIFPHAFRGFPHGAFFAVDNDVEVHAFRVEEILAAMGRSSAK